VIFLWTRNKQIGSKIIRWGLDEHTSHFGIVFFENRGVSAPTIESRMGSGFGLDFFGDFIGRNEIVHALQSPSLGGEDDIFHNTSAKLQGKKYDNLGILFHAWASIRRKMFGVKAPNRNKWGRDEVVYCVEVMQALPKWYLKEIGIDFDEFDLEMTTPEMMYNILLDTQNLVDVTDDFKSES